MAKYIYCTETGRVVRETTLESKCGEDESVVENPKVDPDIDLKKKKRYDGRMIRNETIRETEAHKAYRLEQAKNKIRQRAKDWVGYNIEGVMHAKALRKVIYQQLQRVQAGRPVETVDKVLQNLASEISNWDEFDNCMMSENHVAFKDEPTTRESIALAKQRAKNYQSWDTSSFMASKAMVKVVYQEMEKLSKGEPIDSLDVAFGENVNKIIDNWPVFDQEVLMKNIPLYERNEF